MKTLPFAWLLLTVAVCACCAPAQGAQPVQAYATEIETILDQFEQIQASLEVAFRPDDYIRSLQTLRYRLRRLDEAFGGRAENRYASYMLAHRIEDAYLSLIKKMREGDGTPSDKAIEQVSQINQTQLSVLKVALNAETLGGGEAGWAAVIESYFDLQDYNRAISMAELASKSYPESAALVAKLNEVRKRIKSVQTHLTEAKRLIENRDYHAALKVLDTIEALAAKDATVMELRNLAENALAKVKELEGEALAFEKKEDFKQAFRTWSKVLDLEPGNAQALEKIKAYKETFKIVTRRVYETCPNCKGTGDCEVCKGSKVCFVCDGYRRCTKCKGHGYFASVCVHCLCRECRGSGRCATCGGDGLTYCPQCRGTGYFTTRESRTCPVCRGSGKTRFSNQPCARCGGSGNITVNVDKPCPRCGGRKVERCTRCNGTGICPACNGRGRAESCSVCKGLGRIITECPYCKGSGICLTCDGKGICRFCKGTGRCSACAGKRVVVQELEEELIQGEEAGSLAVASEPSGADVFIDGQPVGTTPFNAEKTAPGEHTLRVTMDGFVPVEFPIETGDDAMVEATFTLVPAPAYDLRVLTVAARRSRVLFKHYTKHDDGSFLVSLTLNGKNRWYKKGDYFLGYRITRLEQISREQYSSTIGATKVVDLSRLVLVNRSGEELVLGLSLPAVVTTYSAKLYDKQYNASWPVHEGSRFGGRLVKSINDIRVILADDNGEELILPAK